MPVVGNGDVFTLEDSVRMKEYTGVKAAMAARGILENPVGCQTMCIQCDIL